MKRNFVNLRADVIDLTDDAAEIVEDDAVYQFCVNAADIHNRISNRTYLVLLRQNYNYYTQADTRPEWYTMVNTIPPLIWWDHYERKYKTNSNINGDVEAEQEATLFYPDVVY
jgi:hypothetical protein